MADLAPIDAEFREVAVAVESRLPALPLNLYGRIPLPDSNPDGSEYQVNMGALSKKTPPAKKKRHFKGFPYIEADYARERLNEAFGNGMWTWYESEYRHGRTYFQATARGEKKSYTTVEVYGWLLCPGYPPIRGMGDAPWAQDDIGDPRFSEVTAHKSATSLAIKDAAKFLGIGADVKEDDSANAALVGTQATIVKFFNDLVSKEGEAKREALKIVKKHAPAAITGEKLDGDMIDELVADSLMADIVELVTKYV